jgi:hypothetical protein
VKCDVDSHVDTVIIRTGRMICEVQVQVILLRCGDFINNLYR